VNDESQKVGTPFPSNVHLDIVKNEPADKPLLKRHDEGAQGKSVRESESEPTKEN
jgi:hypothetical protein